MFALDWRVSCPTPMEFAGHLLELLPENIHSSISESLLEASQNYVDHTVTAFYLTFYKPSVVGASCVARSLTGTDILSSSERQAFWLQLARIIDLIDVMEAQDKLLEGRTLCKPITVSNVVTKKPSIASKVAALSQSKTAIASGNSSPVCATQATRQA